MRQKGTTRHLSDAEKNEVLVVGESGRFHEHLQACDSCRAELAAMQGLLECFGESVRLHGAGLQEELKQERPGRQAARTGRRLRSVWRGKISALRAAKFFAPSLAAALLLAFLVAFHPALTPGHRDRAIAAGTHDAAHVGADGSNTQMRAEKAAVPPDSDDLLMEQVAEQLDQNVPASMLPLTAMVSSEDPSAPRVEKEN